MDEQLTRALGLVPGARDVTPLAGGITNRNYKVLAGDGAYVVRIGGENTAALGIDRARELVALRIAAELGVGAELVAADPSQDVVVTRFIAAKPFDATHPTALARLGAALRRCHDGPRFDGVFDVFATVRGYHREARARGVAMLRCVEPALAVLAEIERGPAPARCPCHNDLLAANLLDDGARVRIIDWEYAAMGDPLFDLGNLAANLRLDDVSPLLAAYGGGVNPARVELMRIASDLREGFWGLVQAGASRLDFDYRAYAEQHLQRVLTARAAPAFAHHLRGAST